MGVKLKKTNVCRLLDKSAIDYELRSYPVDENDLSATHLAEQIGVPIDKIFKTIILLGDKTGYLACVIRGDREVDLKYIAELSGNKSVSPIPMKDLIAVTGYIRGGCSPIGLKKPMDIFLDESMLSCDAIFISAGQRGLQLKISPKDLIDYLQPKLYSQTINN